GHLDMMLNAAMPSRGQSKI
ncbi:hypothetical protein A2U01_0077987, partial [Trifolium medium]|nr:hypothetical protein [Trifolium medium]